MDFTEYVSNFPEIVELLSRSDKNKDVYNAADIFPEDPIGRAKEIVDWLDSTGVTSLPRIPTNCNVLDDDDIDKVWTYILSRKTKTLEKNWSCRPNLIYKPGLDKGCIAPIPNAQFALLDRVVCVDRGCAVPLGTRGSIVGIQAPQTNKPNDDNNEEAFKTTSADAQYALIIMCDPITDLFEPNSSKPASDLTVLTGSLAKLLGVGNGPKVDPEPPKPAEPLRKIKPKLVKLFPYQVINLTQGADSLRQEFKSQPKPVSNKAPPPNLNGTVIVSRVNENTPPTKPVIRMDNVKILKKPAGPATGKIPPLIPNLESTSAKVELPWPPQLKNKSITVEQLFGKAIPAQQETVPEKPTKDFKPTLKKPVKVSLTHTQPESKPVKKQPAALFEQPATTQKKHQVTKVFVNSSLQTKKSGEGQAKKSKEAQANPILNLLCQPKNMERVTTKPAEPSQPKPQNGHNNVPQVIPPQTFVPFPYIPQQFVGGGYSHPVVYFPNQQPQEYFVPTPYPVVMPGRNPMASAFIPQFVPTQAMFPPPPPSHWTSANGHAPERGKQSVRETKGTKNRNVFVPLQVTRSMAGGDPEANIRKEPVQPASVVHPVEVPQPVEGTFIGIV